MQVNACPHLLTFETLSSYQLFLCFSHVVKESRKRFILMFQVISILKFKDIF